MLRASKIKRVGMFSTLAGTLIVVGMSAFNADADWTPLLDKDLSKWENYLSYRHTVNYNGSQPVDANGTLIEPIGYNKDNYGVFTVIQEKDETMLRVSGEIYGCVYTKETFENYHLRLKVKWGDQKYVPRLDELKDSGILYHSIGESGVDYWRSWMLSQEFQIMEGHMGDYWNIATSAIDIRAFLPEGQMNSVASPKQPFLPFGSSIEAEGFCMRSADYESASGQWTELELICFEDKSIHIVNGNVVMILKNSQYNDNGKLLPLRRGKIQLQSESAEVFFKDIEIRPLKSLPVEYEQLF